MNPLRPLNPSETRALLDLLQIRPSKALGQNFLIDANIVRKSMTLAELRPGEPVVEIGPGLGTLTAAILAVGSPLYAVERDRVLVDHLRRTYGEDPCFHLLHADACDHPLAAFRPDPEQPYSIVANLPYAISSPWLEAVLQSPILPRMMVLLVQKETALRLTAPEGSKNRSALGIFLGGAFSARNSHPVSASCFYPKPNVDSVLFPLQQRAKPYRYHPHTRAMIRQLFSQRRKQVQSLTRQFLDSAIATAWLGVLRSASARPEALNDSEWQLLDNLVRAHPGGADEAVKI